ncbi:head maturation protease, ClpP-related [Pseudooceanicola sp. MF1-13]|uniref:head maturation protease, ClpP-related n=1 Tax=Pseudooceanicola sp. MF1-13 TaxID=3379095 RepID=UPI0038920BD0
MTILVDGELVLYGFVGDNFWDEGFTATDVIYALAEVGRSADITVRINSGGGYTDDGIAIYNALVAHQGNVAVIVDAMAASSASLIAMAGDTITMRAGSQMMIHGPSGVAYGKAKDLESYAESARKVGRGMAEIYAEKSGEDVEDLLEEMEGEIWLTPDEAVERGFATDAVKAKSSSVTAFDFRQYANAPERLVAMAEKKDWTFKAKAQKAASAAPTQAKKEKPKMAKQPATADPKPAATTAETVSAGDVKARIKAITEDDAAQGREGLAKHLAFDTEMSAEDAINTLKAAAGDAPSAAGDEPADPKGYQASRSAAAALAQPGSGAAAPKKTTATIDTGGIYASRRARKGA